MFAWLKRRSTPPPAGIELGISGSPNYINGFPGAASFISCDPDHSFAIYKAFHSLAARNLLHLEAELLELQHEQNELDKLLGLRNPDTLECFRSWKTLMDSDDPKQEERRKLNRIIKVKIKEYHEALLLQESVLKIGKPQKEPLRALKIWLDGESEESPRGSTFVGLGATRLDEKDDLVALHPPMERDWLTRLVGFPLVKMLFLESQVDESIGLYSMRKMNHAVSILSIVVATILFITTIVTLYLVTNEKIRLGLICSFTVAFALSVELLTNARRAELFASTAAYCAVLVVFVSGDLGTGAQCCISKVV